MSHIYVQYYFNLISITLTITCLILMSSCFCMAFDTKTNLLLEQATIRATHCMLTWLFTQLVRLVHCIDNTFYMDESFSPEDVEFIENLLDE